MIIVLILLILIFLSSVNINLKASQTNKDNRGVLIIKFLYGLIRIKKEVKGAKLVDEEKGVNGEADKDLKFKVESDSPTSHKSDINYINIRKKIEQIIEIRKRYKHVINYAMSRIDFHTLLWKTEIGFDDAALTGITIGLINILKSNIFVMFKNIKLKPEKIHLKVTPNFKKEILKTNIHCIFTMKIGYIIVTGLKYLWIMARKK